MSLGAADILEWISLQLDADQAWLVGPDHAHRLGYYDRSIPAELDWIDTYRRQLEAMTSDEVREFAERYSGRAGSIAKRGAPLPDSKPFSVFKRAWWVPPPIVRDRT